jgi:ubiquinone/menaquinone biosynthesis C-methylase UbiE/DNA-binding transcriptional ArsR family regulator
MEFWTPFLSGRGLSALSISRYLDLVIGLIGTTRLLKALGDETRLRILHLLSHEELSGSDLMEILNMGQSRVSTQLSLLREVGLVQDRRVGRRSAFQLAPGHAATLGERVLRENERSPEFQADLAGLEALIEKRQNAAGTFSRRVAATFGEEPLPGRTWEGLARALLQLVPVGRCADLGVGDGLLTMLLAEVAEHVTAVDISQEMLGQLRTRAEKRGLDNLETLEADLHDLPLPAASQDLVLFSQALHDAAQPSRALAEARRILAPSGQLLVLDLLAHNEEWVRDKLQHVHLGFTENGLKELIQDAGFERVRVFRAARDPEPPNFMTLVATATPKETP